MQRQVMEAKAMAAQAIAKAQQLETDLMEARRQISVLAEDDDNLEDKVHMLTEALNVATQCLDAAGIREQPLLQGELKVFKLLHAEMNMFRGAVHGTDDKSSSCKAQELRLQVYLPEARAALADSWSRLAENLDNQPTEPADHAPVAAHHDSSNCNALGWSDIRLT